MIISIQDFHAQFGPGRPPIKEAYWDKTVRCDVEIPILTALADHIKARRGLEIGCNTGATSAALLAGNSTIEEYVGVDLNKIWFVDNQPAGHFALSEPRFRLIQSAAGLYDLKPADIGPVNFIFVDADHSYQAIKYDTEFARQIIKPGGVIVWHDYQHPTCPDVRKYIHEINDQPGQPPIVWVKGTTVCYQITAAPDVVTVQEGKSNAKTDRRRVKKSRAILGPDSPADPQE